MHRADEPFEPRVNLFWRPAIKLYLDTNIYNFISLFGEAESTRDFLRDSGHSVEASGTGLIELFGIDDRAMRISTVLTMTTVANAIAEYPESFLEAQEFLVAVRRYRPRWLVERPETSRIQPLLNAHRRRWISAKQSPAHVADGYKVYRPLLEEVASKLKLAQQDFRSITPNLDNPVSAVR